MTDPKGALLPMPSSSTPSWSFTATMGSILVSFIILSVIAMTNAKGALPLATSNTPLWFHMITANMGSILFPCIILSMSFHGLALRYPTIKQLGWIVTTTSSVVMTLAGIPFMYDYFSNGGSVKYVRAIPNFSVSVCRFYQSYLAMDLTLGYVYYPSQLFLIPGWIHHPTYIMIVELFIRKSLPQIFCLCAGIMDVPVILLGSMVLHPDFRNNIAFAVAFFLTRILFNIILGISYFLEDNRIQATGGSYMPSIILAGIFPVHCLWFYRCIEGFYRRASQRRPPIPTIDKDGIPSVDRRHGKRAS